MSASRSNTIPGISKSITRPRPDELDMMSDFFAMGDIPGTAVVNNPPQRSGALKPEKAEKFTFDADTSANYAAKIMSTPGMGLKQDQFKVKLGNVPESPRSGEKFLDGFLSKILGVFPCFSVCNTPLKQ
eukprot:CAMPEP_0194279416 /NCGR_PEP_ID=MMETSP0169-20130528/13918_1 /TAXON_ID=218684 /ORGANISM="Corethron pennatum, Strain L29A3" /LENGTH=128 /DNA_ID=CAMNT_0039023835 /DNA_START=265 /DNA_END=651 /DNA_ORIENTATION=+